jgi:hypothetical protein
MSHEKSRASEWNLLIGKIQYFAASRRRLAAKAITPAGSENSERRGTASSRAENVPHAQRGF